MPVSADMYSDLELPLVEMIEDTLEFLNRYYSPT